MREIRSSILFFFSFSRSPFIASPANTLGPGLTEEQVEGAILKSGYPLQTVVRDVLRTIASSEKFLRIQEEWSYIDRDTKELRNLDLMAELALFDWARKTRIRPWAALLIECKQSSLPFVFFESEAHFVANFPTFAGLRSPNITVTTNDDPSTYTMHLSGALSLTSDPFSHGAPICHTLSKCVRKGAEVELSGSDAYNSLVLPLTKALEHFVSSKAPKPSFWYHDCYASLAIGVIDAPMISVSLKESKPALKAVPWVRVLRHEYKPEADGFRKEELQVIDVVHKDFFSGYCIDHLIPFAKRFAEKALRHQNELATGIGFVTDMATDNKTPLEERLKERSVVAKANRASAIGRNIVRFLLRRTNSN